MSAAAVTQRTLDEQGIKQTQDLTRLVPGLNMVGPAAAGNGTTSATFSVRGVVATVGANLAHGLGQGPIGALVSAWPAVALIGSFELLMMLVRSARRASMEQVPSDMVPEPAPQAGHDEPLVAPDAPALERAVRDQHHAGHSQRAIARDLNIDRRKVKRVFTKESRAKMRDAQKARWAKWHEKRAAKEKKRG